MSVVASLEITTMNGRQELKNVRTFFVFFRFFRQSRPEHHDAGLLEHPAWCMAPFGFNSILKGCQHTRVEHALIEMNVCTPSMLRFKVPGTKIDAVFFLCV